MKKLWASLIVLLTGFTTTVQGADMSNNKILVAYFSATGTTAQVAEKRANAQTEWPVSPNKTPPEGGGCYKLRISWKVARFIRACLISPAPTKRWDAHVQRDVQSDSSPLAHEIQGLYSLVRTWAVLTKSIIYEERSKNKPYFVFVPIKILSVSVSELTKNGGIQDTNIGLWAGPENTKKEEIYLSSFYYGGPGRTWTHDLSVMSGQL